MSNVQDTNGAEHTMENADTPMETPENASKGKGKMAEEMPVDESEEDASEEEGEGEVEEPDEDNMEEIDMDNIVGSRTRGKNIDYAEAAKQMKEQNPEQADDDDDEEDEDFHDEDDEMRD
ncbi:hypothetical protein LTR36_000424 [Oleoguttula mirabilis]|uniref:Histone chaperone domain-containing protein n=1 Tax=Oleoguttula mirabilis TaxID=1507867 RepID=A0AAV9K1P2_9PEZI|nr:hypothetical protein LTR36_000424 [Oleoguttula mirabilis]